MKSLFDGSTFFVDHCVAYDVVRRLRDADHQVFWLRDHLPCNAPDRDVIRTAQDLDAILVSHDSDFSDIVSYPPALYRGLISLQVRNHPEVIPALMDRLLQHLSLWPEMADYRGQLLLVEAHRIRIRE